MHRQNKQAKTTWMPNRKRVLGREEGDLAEAMLNVCTKAHQCMQALRGTVARMRKCPRPVSIQSPEERHDWVFSSDKGESEVKSWRQNFKEDTGSKRENGCRDAKGKGQEHCRRGVNSESRRRSWGPCCWEETVGCPQKKHNLAWGPWTHHLSLNNKPGMTGPSGRPHSIAL